MATRRIKITGKKPPPATPGDTGREEKKRKSPRCHIVVSHYREGKQVESYRRPRGCAFVPQLPKLPLPRTKVKLPPPPPLPKAVKPKAKIPIKTVLEWKKLARYLERYRKGNKYIMPIIVDLGKKLGFLDDFHFMTNEEVFRFLRRRLIWKYEQKGNPTFDLTKEQIEALLRRGLIRDRFAAPAINKVTPDRFKELDTLIKKTSKQGTITPEELERIVKKAIKEVEEDKIRFARELDEWAKESRQYADEAAELLKQYTKEMAKEGVAEKAAKISLGNRIATGVFAALDAIIGLVEGEDPFRAVGGAAASVAGEVAGAAACVAAGLPSGGIGTAICGAIASFAAGYAFDRIDETGVIRNIPKNIKETAKKIGEAVKNLKPTKKPQTSTPTPIPSPNPSPSPKPTPKPSPGSDKEQKQAKPSPYPGIQIVGTDKNGKPKYVTGNPDAPTAIWVRTKNGGYWRSLRIGEKPTINPDTGKPIGADPTPTPAQKPKPSPYPGITIVGTDKKGRPKYKAGDYTWVRTKRGGYWRGEGNNKPTINPDTGKPLTPTPIPSPSPSPNPVPTPSPKPSRAPSSDAVPAPTPVPSPTPSPWSDGGTIPPNIIEPNIVPPNISGASPPSNQGSDRSPSNDRGNDRKPTHPDFTCVIREDGTGYWRRKKGTPKDAPKPSIPCKPL